MAGRRLAQPVYPHSRTNRTARSCRLFAPNRHAGAVTTLPLSRNERTLPRDGSGRPKPRRNLSCPRRASGSSTPRVGLRRCHEHMCRFMHAAVCRRCSTALAGQNFGAWGRHIGIAFWRRAYDHPPWRAGATSIAVKDLMSEGFLSAARPTGPLLSRAIGDLQLGEPIIVPLICPTCQNILCDIAQSPPAGDHPLLCMGLFSIFWLRGGLKGPAEALKASRHAGRRRRRRARPAPPQ